MEHLQTGDAASQLGDKGAYEIIESRLQKLAAVHLSKGVIDAHFEVNSITTSSQTFYNSLSDNSQTPGLASSNNEPNCCTHVKSPENDLTLTTSTLPYYSRVIGPPGGKRSLAADNRGRIARALVSSDEIGLG